MSQAQKNADVILLMLNNRAKACNELEHSLWIFDSLMYLRTGKPITDYTYEAFVGGTIDTCRARISGHSKSRFLNELKTIAIIDSSNYEPFLNEYPNTDIFSSLEIKTAWDAYEDVHGYSSGHKFYPRAKNIISIAIPGEIIPLNIILASSLGKITQGDLDWDASLKK